MYIQQMCLGYHLLPSQQAQTSCLFYVVGLLRCTNIAWSRSLPSKTPRVPVWVAPGEAGAQNFSELTIPVMFGVSFIFVEVCVIWVNRVSFLVEPWRLSSGILFQKWLLHRASDAWVKDNTEVQEKILVNMQIIASSREKGRCSAFRVQHFPSSKDATHWRGRGWHTFNPSTHSEAEVGRSPSSRPARATSWHLVSSGGKKVLRFNLTAVKTDIMSPNPNLYNLKFPYL